MRVEGTGFGVWGLGFRVQGLESRVEGSGLRVWGLGSRVEGGVEQRAFSTGMDPMFLSHRKCVQIRFAKGNSRTNL